jgi:hypothetical protein
MLNINNPNPISVNKELSKYIINETNKSLEKYKSYVNNRNIINNDKLVINGYFKKDRLFVPFVSLLSFLIGYNLRKLTHG